MKLRCKWFGHKPSGSWESAIGARDVMRCKRCSDVLEERPVLQRHIERYARAHRPAGRISNTWPQTGTATPPPQSSGVDPLMAGVIGYAIGSMGSNNAHAAPIEHRREESQFIGGGGDYGGGGASANFETCSPSSSDSSSSYDSGSSSSDSGSSSSDSGGGGGGGC